MKSRYLKIIASALLSLPCLMVAAEDENVVISSSVSDSVSTVSSVADSNPAPVQDDLLGAHPWKSSADATVSPFMSNWSLILSLGFNSFDGDFNSEMKHPIAFPTVGLGVEYTFSPYIGLGLDYTFDMYRVSGKSDAHAAVLLEGMAHKVGLYLPVDLVSCFAPRAKDRIFMMQLLAGGGLAWYTNTIAYAQADRGNTKNAEPQSMNGEYKLCPYMSIGLNLEFNLGRSVGLGVKGVYNYFTRDDIDNRFGGASVNNDGLVDVALVLRYKINAQKRSHERNISGEQDADLTMVARGLTPISELTPERMAEEIADRGLLQRGGTDTVVICKRDTVYMQSDVVREVGQELCGFVYFERGGARLTESGLIAVQQLAKQMKRDTSLCAVITGYCDNTGSDTFNSRLSVERAEVVADELAEEYGVSRENMLVCGAGKIAGKRSKGDYSANRRVEVELLSKDAFATRVAEQKSSQSKGQVSEKKDDSARIVIVEKGMTLAGLARTYYGDATQWMKIYEANKDVISNPDRLAEGMRIVVP